MKDGLPSTKKEIDDFIESFGKDLPRLSKEWDEAHKDMTRPPRRDVIIN